MIHMISIPDPRLHAPVVARPPERLGTVACPSGRLAVIDVGLLGDAWGDWAIVVDGVPTDRDDRDDMDAVNR
jgi:hypothetical protein